MTISNTIESYRKRRKQLIPLVLGGLAVILVVVGIIIMVTSLGGGGGFTLFASKTPTPTITPTPTNTSPPTETPTITPTFTETPTVTPSGPYPYIVQEGDYLVKISTDHGLGGDVLLILALNPYFPDTNTGIDPNNQEKIYPGQTIILPPPGYIMPTVTPPVDAPPGTRVNYIVQPGDNLGSIAAKLNSTVDRIVLANKDVLKDGLASVIYPGNVLVVPVNLVTQVPTPKPTNTPTATPTP